MQSQWSALLAVERRAGRGGIVWPEPIVRGLPFEIVLPMPMDVTGDAFKMNFSIGPDVPGLVTKIATIGSYSGGTTNVTIALTTANVATIAAAASDSDGDGVAEVLADLLWQEGAIGDWRRASLNSVPISGKAADA